MGGTPVKYHCGPAELLEKRKPRELGLEYTSVQRIELSGDRSVATAAEEACLVVVEGSVGYSCVESSGTAVFKDMLFLPPGCEARLRSEGAVVMWFGAPSDRAGEPTHIRFSDIDDDPKTHEVFGKPENNTRRDVWHFIGSDFPCSRLMMGLCRGEPGGWTVWPPHEHGAQREEVYVYFGMGKAFGLQCVYRSLVEPDAVVMVRDGDLVSIPEGYHPNVGCPAGGISFVYCMVSKEPGRRDFLDLQFQEIYGDSF
jgi:5-deoxy-glucuronate isomerase